MSVVLSDVKWVPVRHHAKERTPIATAQMSGTRHFRMFWEVVIIEGLFTSLRRFTDVIVKTVTRAKSTYKLYSRSRFANVKILNRSHEKMDFKFGVSTESQIQNFRSVGAMKLFLWPFENCRSRQ